MGTRWMLAAASAALVAACTRLPPPEEVGADDGDEPAVHEPQSHHTGNVMVLDSASLHSGDPNLLHVLRDHIATMTVRTGHRNCPEVTLRGQQSVLGSNDPVIYVDGTRAADTCVLEMLNVADVESVEVFPLGVRAGYMASSTGLIFITSRTGL